eukprot:PhF_6_TR13449/c0_g1_i2/m.21517/K10393/KIF2_24, MCAK; kinesin family member 2/24
MLVQSDTNNTPSADSPGGLMMVGSSEAWAHPSSKIVNGKPGGVNGTNNNGDTSLPEIRNRRSELERRMTPPPKAPPPAGKDPRQSYQNPEFPSAAEMYENAMQKARERRKSGNLGIGGGGGGNGLHQVNSSNNLRGGVVGAAVKKKGQQPPPPPPVAVTTAFAGDLTPPQVGLTSPISVVSDDSSVNLPPIRSSRSLLNNNSIHMNSNGAGDTSARVNFAPHLTPTSDVAGTADDYEGAGLNSARISARHRRKASVDSDGGGGGGGGIGGYETAPESGADLLGLREPREKRKKGKGRIKVLVRKRPLGAGENGSDIVEVNSRTGLAIRETKIRVDLTEYTDCHTYEFDRSYGETDSNRCVYEDVASTLLETVLEGGSASCFAYGQTGSGKTYTMMGTDQEPGLYELAARDLFGRINESHQIYVSLYEIYCNSLFDLLNGRAVLHSREDGNKKINICGLTYHHVKHAESLLRTVGRGAHQRRTGSTGANEQSSRSHAILQITIRDSGNENFLGCLNLVDLAGSERAADTAASDRQTRMEGAEINKSLLALKECIRGLDENKKHIPFRGSKLTEVLRDAFVGNSRTVMIATVSPSSLNAEHTLNTLRYAYRVKGLSIERTEPSKERNAPQRRCKSEVRKVAKQNPLEPKRPKHPKKYKHHKERGGGGMGGDDGGDVLNDVTPRTSRRPTLDMEAELIRLQEEMAYMRTLKKVDEERIRLLEGHNQGLQQRIQQLEDHMCVKCKNTM